MTTSALLSLLTQLERELHGLAARSDARRLGELLHPEFVEFGCSGRRYDFSEIIAQLQQEPPPTAIHSQDFLISAESQLIEPVRAERSLRQQAKSKHLDGDTLRLRRCAPTLWVNGGSAAEIRH